MLWIVVWYHLQRGNTKKRTVQVMGWFFSCIPSMSSNVSCVCFNALHSYFIWHHYDNEVHRGVTVCCGKQSTWCQKQEWSRSVVHRDAFPCPLLLNWNRTTSVHRVLHDPKWSIVFFHLHFPSVKKLPLFKLPASGSTLWDWTWYRVQHLNSSFLPKHCHAGLCGAYLSPRNNG